MHPFFGAATAKLIGIVSTLVVAVGIFHIPIIGNMLLGLPTSTDVPYQKAISPPNISTSTTAKQTTVGTSNLTSSSPSKTVKIYTEKDAIAKAVASGFWDSYVGTTTPNIILRQKDASALDGQAWFIEATKGCNLKDTATQYALIPQFEVDQVTGATHFYSQCELFPKGGGDE